MRLYIVAVGFDEEVAERHQYFFKTGESPEIVLRKVKYELEGKNFHFDSLMEINYADGRTIRLSKEGKPQEFLYAGFVGYYMEGDPIEHHNFIFIVEKNLEAARAKAKQVAKMVEGITPHLDAIKELREVEGWMVIPEASSGEPNRLFYYDDIKEILKSV